MQEPALGMIEYNSIAKGIFSADAIAKKAPVRIHASHSISPGKYLNLFSGEVGDVEESYGAGIAAGGDGVVNDILIPHIHPEVLDVMEGNNPTQNFGAIGILETFSVCSCVYAADLAVKHTPIQLVEMKLGTGLGGKGYVVMTGDLHQLEASMEVAWRYAQKEGMLANHEIIPSPHPGFLEKVFQR